MASTSPQKRKLETLAGGTNGDEEVLGPRPTKAYRNNEFLNSSSARLIRVMCELEEPQTRLEDNNVENIVMFFGSARAKPKKEYEAAVIEAEAKCKASPDDAKASSALDRLRKQAFLIPMFDAVRDLAQMLTAWSMKRESEGKAPYTVGTGGGPGMMVAANQGASNAGGKSVGFGISLPFEDGLNPYVSPELGLEFHYFFTRKYWMAYKCMGLVVAPGGLGTCDELFELITLMQTGKIKRALPVILIGKKFWHACINWQAFVDYGMISEHDANQLVFADTAEEAFPHLVAGIEKMETEEHHLPHKK
uniref:Cytokinin riboside 5'-monophosphate phosphoribohydrolase n=1 Tax=Alexandrium catenella TaxID=2925 RepID=A0A7S1S0B3_ALECA